MTGQKLSFVCADRNSMSISWVSLRYLEHHSARRPERAGGARDSIYQKKAAQVPLTVVVFMAALKVPYCMSVRAESTSATLT